MSENNKAIIEKVNMAFAENKVEDFLSLCADDVVWNMVGDKKNEGKDTIREWMGSHGHSDPPKFTVNKLFAEDDSVACHGDMTMKGEDGAENTYSYCDVYEFSGGKITRLDSYVVKIKPESEQTDAAAA